MLDHRSGITAPIDRRYFAQGEQRKNSNTWENYYYCRDHLGSIRDVIKSVGTTNTLVARYDPYDKRLTQYEAPSYICDLGYTGHLTVPSPVAGQTEMVLTNFRAYDPQLAIWLSADPIGEEGGMNLYAYVLGDPINGGDPYGLEFWAWDGTAGAWAENATTFSAGFSDNFTFGLTGAIRGTYAGNNDVDRCSNSYKGGDYTATGIQLAAGGAGLAKGIARGGFKISAKAAYREGTSMTWRNVRKRLGYHGVVDAGEQVHHWMIPQNGWGKAITGSIKNLPFNLMPIADDAHKLAHNGNILQKIMYGVPAWAKQAAGGLGAGAAHAASGSGDCP